MTARTSGSANRARKSAIVSVACVVLFAVVMHWPVFLQGKTVSAFDISYFVMGAYKSSRPSDVASPSNGLLSDPVLLFNVWDKAMYEGVLEFPWLWNPYTACGSPLLANAQSAPFCPLKAIAYGPFGVYRGFGVLCFLKMLCAGLFMWLYMRALGTGYLARTLGSISFMACGFIIAWLQYPITSVSFTLPLMFLACEELLRRRWRRGVLIAAAATAVGLLGGHPESSFHITVAASVYLAGRLAFSLFGRRDERSLPPRQGAACVGVFVLAVLLGATVAAVQVLPTAEAVRRSALLTKRSATPAGHGASSMLSLGNRTRMHNQVLSHLAPNTWGNPSLHGHWWNRFSNFNESAGYVGIGVLLWAVFGWRCFRRSPVIRTLCILQLISLGFIVKLPLVTMSLGALPLFNVAANNRLLLVFCFTSAAIAGLVLDRLLKAKKRSETDPQDSPGESPFWLSLVWMSVIALAFTALVVRDYLLRFANNPHDWIPPYGRRQLAHFLVFLAPACCLVFLPRLGERVRRATAAALVCLVAIDLFLVHSRFNPFLAPDHHYPDTPATRVLQAEPAPTRVLPVPTQISPNIITVYELEDPRIYDAVVYGPYSEFLSRLGWRSNWGVQREVNLRLCSIAGIRFIWAEPDWALESAEGPEPDHEGAYEIVYEDEDSTIFENHDALPLAYVSHQWRAVSSPDEAFDALVHQAFPWQTCVTLEAQDDGQNRPPGASEPRPHVPATIAEHRSHSVTVDVPELSAGLLVLNDCFHPGWKAFVDGERRPIHRVNGTFRGVFVDTGDEQVVFRYDPAAFRYGAILSIAGLAIFVAIATRIPDRLLRKPATTQL